MMARRHVAFGLALVFCLALGDEMNAWAETAEGEWKTYRNSTYQFSIGYPAKLLEPLEGDARFFFRSSHAPVWLRLCFAPIPRTDFYCEVEPGFTPIPLKELVEPEIVHATCDRGGDAVEHQSLQSLPMGSLRNNNQISH